MVSLAASYGLAAVRRQSRVSIVALAATAQPQRTYIGMYLVHNISTGS